MDGHALGRRAAPAEEGRGAGVEIAALRGREGGGHGRPQDRMQEAQRVAALDHAGARERAGGRVGGLRIQAGQLGGQRQVGLLEHGERPREGAGEGGQGGEARPQRAREGLGSHAGHAAGVRGVGRDAALAQAPRQLVQEQGVAARRLVARAGERGVGGASELGREELPGRVGTQRVEAERLGVGIPARAVSDGGGSSASPVRTPATTSTASA
jgi:hypothetical protein